MKKWNLKTFSFFFSSNPIRSDTESADVKQIKFKKYKINFDGLFMKKPQKIINVEKNNDAEAPVEDPNDDAAPSEATVIMEDDPPKSVS